MKNNPRETGSTTGALQSIQLNVGFDGQPNKALNVIAYIFSRQGALLAARPLSEGTLQLELDPAQLRTARIFFGPESPRTSEKELITLDTMDKIHAYEAIWKYSPDQKAYDLLPIPELLWKWWFLCSCRVRGQVVKPVSIAGNISNLPICNARVHICEVDPIWWIIPRLPDPIVIRLRDELLAELERPHPIPLPDPPPFVFDPGVIDPTPERVAVLNRATLQSRLLRPGDAVAFNPQPDPPGDLRIGRVDAVALNPQPLPPRESALSLAALPIETRSALSSASVPLLRQTLQNNIALIRPYLCIWPWLRPYFCRCDEIAVLTTDAQGRFDTNIYYFCFGDHPDLYFWVECFIGGAWTTVYHPNPICCHTYWNYDCGSEVTLRVTDPRVVPCGTPPEDLPGLQVGILSIGQNVSIHEIPVDSTSSLPYSGSASEGLANGTHPFGGQLEPHVNFSRSALLALNITHYRWSYRQLTAGDGVTHVSDPWHTMNRNVIRHYQVFNPITSSLSYPAYSLGPDAAYPGLDLFQIQPINAPTGFAEDWTPNVDVREDSASAFFLSHLTQGGNAALGAGKYELKFELFNTAGGVATPVNWTTTGIALKVPDVDAPFGANTVTTVDADDHHRFKNGAGETLAFRLVLHVDNNVCDSLLFPISGAGLAVDDDCGFIEYQPGTSAHISFMAAHPHDFATFSYDTVRGTAIDVPQAEASGQVNVASANGFVRSGNIFSKDVPVSTLLTVNTPLGHTPCIKAAFSELLTVEAMATDGWSQLSYLNPAVNPKHAAYALEPA